MAGSGITGILLINKNNERKAINRLLIHQRKDAKLNDWVMNLNLDTNKIGKSLINHPEYITVWLNDLRNNNMLFASNALAFQANGQYITFNELYGEGRYAVAFARINGFLQLMTINSRLPIEHVKIGYDPYKTCRVPLIYKKVENRFKTINLP